MMMNPSKRHQQETTLKELLPSVPYFRDLDKETVQTIAERMHFRDVPSGTPLFFEGEGTGEVPLYLVVRGTIRVYKSSMRGREQVLRLFEKGETFAEVPLFDGGAYPANADAMVDSTVAVLPRPDFLLLMREYPEVAVAATQLLGDRLRHFNVLIEDLSLRRVRSRVARRILDSEQRVTQAQMAAMSGTSREMISRSLHQLEDEGVIDLGEQEIVIRDLARLRQIVDEG